MRAFASVRNIDSISLRSAGGAPLKTRPLAIRPVHLIRNAASAASALKVRRETVVRIKIPGLDPDVAARLESSINASLSECGCQLGALFLVVAVTTAAVYNVMQWRAVSEAPIATIGTELIIAFVASGIGRAAGLARARHGLRKTLSEVSHLIPEQGAKEAKWAA